MPSVDKNLSLLFIVNILVAIYWNILSTFIPLFIRHLGASVFNVSLVLFIGGSTATIVMLPSGILSDRFGRRKMIILSVAFLIIAPFLYSIANRWEETIFYTMIYLGSISFFIPARMAMIADRVNLLSLSTAYGLMNLAWPIGGILGPPIGGYLADVYGWTIFYLTLSIIALISFIISLFIIESKEKSETRGEKFTNGKKFTISVVFILIVFLSIHIMGNTARGILNTIFPFYLTDIFMKSKTEVGLFFSVGHGIATLITQYPSGFLADRIGRKKIMAYSVLFIPVLSILLIFTQNYIITLLIYMGITALWSATWPAAAAYLIEISSISKRGFMMGVRLTAVRLGFTIGPLIGGFLWDNFDIATSFYFVTAFFASSFIFILFLRE